MDSVKQNFFSYFFKFILFPIKLYLLSFKTFLKFAVVHVIIIVLGASVYLTSVLSDMPEVSKLLNYKPFLEVQFSDRNGEPMYTMAEEKRSYVKISDMPQDIKNAFLAAEDKDFYSHNGFDLFGIARAGLSDVLILLKLTPQRQISGGSTITQQVVKNILLSRDKKISRKIKEFVLAYKISQILSKDEVLEIYLNHIYFGNKAFGIAAASEVYFGKTLQNLTIEECALLATLVKAPSDVNPFKDINKSRTRRDWVLKRMQKLNFISESKYEDAVKKDIILSEESRKKKESARLASWFVKKYFKDNANLTEEDFLVQGLKFNLTIDKWLQDMAQAALNNGLIEAEKKLLKPMEPVVHLTEFAKNNWLSFKDKIQKPLNLCGMRLAVVTDITKEYIELGVFEEKELIKVKTQELDWVQKKYQDRSNPETLKMKKPFEQIFSKGDVYPVVKNNNNYELTLLPSLNGSIVMINPSNGEILTMVGGYCDMPAALNRSVEAIRQSGSAIKPFIYAAALENGVLPSDVFIDSEISYRGEDGTIWNPKNDSKKSYGPVTLRYGLEHSLNTVTIRIMERVGIKKIVDFLKSLKLSKNIEHDVSIGLGTLETSPLNLTRAYAIFTNEGKLPNLKLIKAVTAVNSDGNLNLDNKNLQTITQEQLFLEKKNEEELLDSDSSLRKSNDSESALVLSSRTAYQIFSILKGATVRGTSYFVNKLDMPIGAKTGTSDKGKDLWFFFVSRDIVGGIFIGADSPTQTNLYGGSAAGPIGLEILTKLKENKTYRIQAPKMPNGMKFIRLEVRTGKRAAAQSAGGSVVDEVFKEEDDISKIKNEEESSIVIEGEDLF